MAVSKVYYANMKTSFTENLPQKLERLIKTAGIKEIESLFMLALKSSFPIF